MDSTLALVASAQLASEERETKLGFPPFLILLGETGTTLTSWSHLILSTRTGISLSPAQKFKEQEAKTSFFSLIPYTPVLGQAQPSPNLCMSYNKHEP